MVHVGEAAALTTAATGVPSQFQSRPGCWPASKRSNSTYPFAKALVTANDSGNVPGKRTNTDTETAPYRAPFYSFEHSKISNAYSGCSLHTALFYLGYVVGPTCRSPSLLVFACCPQLLQNWRYSDNATDHWRNPAHQMKALGSSISLDWFG